MNTVHYVSFLMPGSLMANEETRAVEVRDVQPSGIPTNAYGYWFFSRTEVVVDGELVVGQRRDPSRMTYFGKRYTLTEVEALPGDNRILISNIKSNSYDGVVKTPSGNWAPLYAGDQVIERLQT